MHLVKWSLHNKSMLHKTHYNYYLGMESVHYEGVLNPDVPKQPDLQPQD